MTLLACSNCLDQSADMYGKTLTVEQKSAMQMCTVCGLQVNATDCSRRASQGHSTLQQLTASVLHNACHANVQSRMTYVI